MNKSYAKNIELLTAVLTNLDKPNFANLPTTNNDSISEVNLKNGENAASHGADK